MGDTFIFPVTEPWWGYPSSWRDSLLDVVDAATTHWVKMVSDADTQRYAIIEWMIVNLSLFCRDH